MFQKQSVDGDGEVGHLRSSLMMASITKQTARRINPLPYCTAASVPRIALPSLEVISSRPERQPIKINPRLTINRMPFTIRNPTVDGLGFDVAVFGGGAVFGGA